MSPFPLLLVLISQHLINALVYDDIITGSDFACISTGECETKILRCLPNQPCNVLCSSDISCRNTKVECPANSECTVTCSYSGVITPSMNAPQVCIHIIINAEQSTLLTINTNYGQNGNHSEPRHMENANISCPLIGRRNCHINCRGNDLMRQANIYANEGFNDLVLNRTTFPGITNMAVGICMRAATVHCASEPGDISFGASCTIANKGFVDTKDGTTGELCATRDDDTCENMLLPTLDPTESPTVDPSVVITSSPTSMETTMDNATNTTGAPFEKIEPGLTDTQLALVIVLPTVAVLCIILSMLFVSCSISATKYIIYALRCVFE